VLRSQELWRRNRQGSLWTPSWWPSDLAPLFWPALALFLAALLGSALVLLLRVWPSGPDPAAPAAVVQSAPEPQQSSEPISDPEVTQAPALVEEPPVQPIEPMEPSDADAFDLEPEEFEGPYAPDPLLELVQRPEADGLLVQAEGVADQSLLILQVRPAFPALTPQEQQRRAEVWQLWANQLGYEHLELRDSRSGLIARDALVGEGMIVLSESPST
jgi:hypothetical protein